MLGSAPNGGCERRRRWPRRRSRLRREYKSFWLARVLQAETKPRDHTPIGVELHINHLLRSVVGKPIDKTTLPPDPVPFVIE